MKFKPVFVEATNLDDCWFQLLNELCIHGRQYKITEGSYAGTYRLKFDYVAGFIHYPHTLPLAPYVSPDSGLSPPTTDDDIQEYFTNYLMNSELSKNEDYRYSTWLVGGDYYVPAMSVSDTTYPGRITYNYHPNIVRVPNQIKWIINHFNTKGLGNEHCYVTIGYPESNYAYDIPYSNENERKTSPCLRGLDFGVVDGYLTTNVIYRSWDLISGFPTNMGGFTLLNQYVAYNIGVEPGPLSFSCKSLHAYDHAYDYMKTRVRA